MFVLIALLCFVLALFHVPFPVDWVVLGWIFLSLHWLLGDRVWAPIRRT